MSHSRGLKRKLAFFHGDSHKVSAVERIQQEIEFELQRKERLEWYLNEVLQEKAALTRFDDLPPAAAAASSVAAAATSSTPSSSAVVVAQASSSTSSSSSPSSTTTPATTRTYSTADLSRWTAHTTTATVGPHAEERDHHNTTSTAPASDSTTSSSSSSLSADVSCERCGRQYVDSQRTCRCRNFESVKKRQRCLSRFLRTGHMLEVASGPSAPAAAASDAWAAALLPDMPTGQLNPNYHHHHPQASGHAVTAAELQPEDRLANLSDEDFLRAILDEAFGCDTDSVKDSSLSALGEKGHHRRQRRASVVEQDSFFSASAPVFGY